MIPPLPPATPFVPEASGDGPAVVPASEGDAFAELLMAAGVSAEIDAAGPDARSLGDEPRTQQATGDRSLLEPAGESATPNMRELPAAAERFNEHGFFGDAVESGLSAAQPQCTYGEAAAPASGPVFIHPGAATLPEQAEALSLANLPSITGLEPGPKPIPPPASSPRIASGLLPARPSAPAPLPTRADAVEPEPVAAVSTRQVCRTAEPPRASVSVALHQLDTGLRVVARTAALDEQQRLRLSEEITALFARHGLRPPAIHIRAPLTFPQED